MKSRCSYNLVFDDTRCLWPLNSVASYWFLAILLFCSNTTQAIIVSIFSYTNIRVEITRWCFDFFWSLTTEHRFLLQYLYFHRLHLHLLDCNDIGIVCLIFTYYSFRFYIRKYYSLSSSLVHYDSSAFHIIQNMSSNFDWRL